MNATPAGIAPETIQTLIAQAAASGLSTDDYLRKHIHNKLTTSPGDFSNQTKQNSV
jgi:hypothetical protein